MRDKARVVVGFLLDVGGAFLNSGAVICGVSRTRRPVCISQLAVAVVKCGRLQMYGTWRRVSGAAEKICPNWQGPQIYGVDVPLHLWARDEKIPLFFSHKHPPYPECTSPLPFFLSFRPILHAMLLCWKGSGSQQCGSVVWTGWGKQKEGVAFCWSH